MSIAHAARTRAIDNTTKHEIATQICRRLLQDDALCPNYIDAIGGRVSTGLICQNHGGLFKLSLDRIRTKEEGNYVPNFPSPNAMANLRLVPLAMSLLL